MKAEVPFFLTNFDIHSFFHNHHTLRKVAPLDTGAPDVRAARAAATEGYFAALQGAESLTVPPNGIETATILQDQHGLRPRPSHVQLFFLQRLWYHSMSTEKYGQARESRSRSTLARSTSYTDGLMAACSSMAVRNTLLFMLPTR